MRDRITMEQMRMIIVTVLSSLLAILTPMKGFVEALVLVWAFNVWSGMRADGVSIITCKNFSWSKLKTAFVELILYLIILCLFRIVMYACNDADESLYVVKILTYIFSYIYLQNSFKNLVKAYPRSKALWVIYLAIRFEFKRMLPSNVGTMIERYEEHEKNQNKKVR